MGKSSYYCLSGCYRLLPVAVVTFVFLSATGGYKLLQSIAFPSLAAECHYMQIAVLFLSVHCYSKGVSTP